MTNVGGWSLELANRQLMWTPQTHRIHELPEDFVPTVDGAIDFYTEESRSIISAAVATAIEDGESYDLELQIRTAKGNVRWVHTMGTAESGSTLDASSPCQRTLGAILNRRAVSILPNLAPRVRLPIRR